MEGIILGQKLDTSKDKKGNGVSLTAPWVSSKKTAYSEYKSGPTIILPHSQTATGETQYFGPGGIKPNHSRPPDWKEKSLGLSSSQQIPHTEYQDRDVFEDASENGILSNDESDMELVAETPGLGHQLETENLMHTN
jgi:hypothetical protein